MASSDPLDDRASSNPVEEIGDEISFRDDWEPSSQRFDSGQQKETDESDALESQTIYTPPSSNEPLNSDEMYSEEAPLLFDDPPKYQETAPVSVEWSRRTSEKAVSAQEPVPTNPDEDRPNSRRRPPRFHPEVYTFMAILALVCNAIMCFRIWRGDVSDKPSQGEMGAATPLSRDIVIDTGSDPITGDYPLYDLLSLSTSSGDIAVVINPEEADPSDPSKPARLAVRSESGSISVSFSSPPAASMPELQRQIELVVTSDAGTLATLKSLADKLGYKAFKANTKPSVPSRPYEIDIETSSGSISGRYIFSTSASIRSISGSISAQLVPIVCLDPDTTAGFPTHVSLDTTTVSGSTDIHLTEPYFIHSTYSESSPVDVQDGSSSGEASFTSSHTSDSGSLLISYPQSWAGNITATSSGQGSIWIGGQGVEVKESDPQRVSGVKKPERGREDRVWWGSEGNMDVSVEAGGGGAVQFWVGR